MMPSQDSNPNDQSEVLPRHRIVIMICVAVFAGSGIAWYLEGTGFRSYPGTIEARTTVVTSSGAARVEGVSIKPGQSVVPGDALFQLVDARLQERIASKQREISEFEAELNRTRAAADVELAWRRRELQSEIFETRLKMAGLMQEKLNRQVEQIAWREYLTSGESHGNSMSDTNSPFRAISRELQRPDERRLQALLKEDAATAAAEALTAQVALCEERLKKLEMFDKDLESKVLLSSGVQLAETRFNGAKQQLVSLESQLNELTMTSPTYGTVGEIKFQPGDQIADGSKLVEILDDQQPHIVAQIPSSAASAIRQGSKVTIHFPDEQKRIGIVASIPAQTTSIVGQPESVLEVKIEPAGKIWPKLALGSNVKILLQ